jgi:broad specificity phosphatase PhoE
VTTFYIMRHGNADRAGVLYGRGSGVHLSEHGRAQAQRLGERLSSTPLAAVYCSPMERTRETAEEVAKHHNLRVDVLPGITEVDFGEWTGQSFETLEAVPRWKLFHVFRSGIRPPGGELMVEVQRRMVAEIDRLRETHRDGAVALVSHGDPIKCLLAHYGGIPLDFILRLEVNTGSLSVLALADHGPSIRCINDTGEAIPPF